MCLSNLEASDREREKALSCFRCERGSVIVHATAGRFMIQCAVCQWSVFEKDFDTARAAWEKGIAA